MKPKQSEDTSFSMAELEKGLVLAGLLTPISIQELDALEALKTFENDKKSKEASTTSTANSSKLYFKRVVLAAEIVSELHQEPTFGRVKFQKLVYLCEHAALMDVQQRYLKLVAGPFDNKFMHTIEKEFKRQNWFVIEKVTEKEITRSKYFPLENCLNYKKYYLAYFQSTQHKIASIIELFRKKNTDFAEISATLFACHLELKESGIPCDNEQLLSLFYEWSEHKKQFPEGTVLSNWAWLQEHGLVNL